MKIENVYVEITNRCNLNCRTCYNQSGLNRETVEMSPEQLEGIFLRFRSYGMKRLLLSGGEPSLHSQFHRILSLADTYPALSVSIVTNGTNHDPVLINALNTKPGMGLQISLDGSCEEINRITRGVGSFDKAIAFAKQIHMKNRPRLKMVISRCNIEDVEPFYRLAMSLGFQPEYAFIYRSGNARDAWEEKCLSAREKLHVLKLLDRLNGELGGDAFLPRCTYGCPFTMGVKDVSLSVQVDGTVLPCQGMHDAGYSVGNAFTSTDEEIMAGMERIVSLAQARMTVDYGCSRCLLKETCGHGCIAGGVTQTGDPLGDDGECAYRKSAFLGFELNRLR